jgi:hypothetical protein
MNTSITLGFMALACAIGSLYYGIRIATELQARGLQANPVLIRWMIFNYIDKYRRVTLEEAGTIGPLYYPCVTLSALAAVFAFGAILTLTS